MIRAEQNALGTVFHSPREVVRRPSEKTMISLANLMEESLQIAWDYLERTGEIEDNWVASRYLGDAIELMIRHGQRSRLVLSNRAIPGCQYRGREAGTGRAI